MSDKKKIYADLHSRMVQTYGEGYANKTNAIKDSATSAAFIASQPFVGSCKIIKSKPRAKVFKDEYGKFVRIPVTFNIDLYLDHGEKNLSLNEIKNRLDEMDSMELVDLVFDAMDYKNVIKG